MQPLKISISGDYIDTQIYSGRLYLWNMNGTLSVYSWYDIIEYLNNRLESKIILNNAFLDNNYLYESGILNILRDKDFKDLYLKKYYSIQNKELILTEEEMKLFLIGEQETPSGEIPTDTEIYSNKLYYINDKGLFSAGANKKTKKPVSTRPVKLWDCILYSIKANKYPQMALSGGDDGLFELSITNNSLYNSSEIDNNIYKLSDGNSIFANYAFLSIVNSSEKNSSIALFKWKKIDDAFTEKRYLREYNKSIGLNIGKSEREFTWGVDDKIYTATKDKLLIRKFNNYAKIDEDENYLEILNEVKIDNNSVDIINGGTSYFGTVIEYNDKLSVLQSDNNIFTINSRITRWRVFNRSKNYLNHLHVILDDKIDIYSFSNDYFINQEEKEYGITYQDIKDKKPKYTL